MSSSNVIINIQDLPDEVVRFLYEMDEKAVQDFLNAYTPEGEVDHFRVQNLVEEFMTNQTPLDELPEVLGMSLSVPEDKEQSAAAYFATHFLFPIAGVIEGDVAGQIVRWGGSLEDLKGIENIVVPEMSAEEVASKAAEDLGLQFAEENEYKRFASIIASYVKGIRDSSETQETLTKDRKVGGLGMDGVETEKVMTYLRDKLSFLKVTSKETVQPTMADIRAPQSAPVGFEGPVVLKQGWKEPVQEEEEQAVGAIHESPTLEEAPEIAEEEVVEEIVEEPVQDASIEEELEDSIKETVGGIQESPVQTNEKTEESNAPADLPIAEEVVEEVRKETVGAIHESPALEETPSASQEITDEEKQKMKELLEEIKEQQEQLKELTKKKPEPVQEELTEEQKQEIAEKKRIFTEKDKERIKQARETIATLKIKEFPGEGVIKPVEEPAPEEASTPEPAPQPEVAPEPEQSPEPEAQELTIDDVAADVLAQAEAKMEQEAQEMPTVVPEPEVVPAPTPKPQPATPPLPKKQEEDPNKALHEVLAKTIDEVGLDLSDADFKNRLEKVVETRLRNVRDAYATRDLLGRAKESGGLELKGAELADVSVTIERYAKEYQAAEAAKVKTERPIMRHTAREQKKEGVAEQEAHALAKRYAEMTGKAPDQQVHPAAPTGARTTLATSVEEHIAGQHDKIDTAKVKEAVENMAKEMPPARPIAHSHATIPGKQGKPQMTDVRFAPKLTGPLDELAQMNLQKFRRLSKDPTHATTKIKDLVALLTDQGMERHIEAVHAWRQSPMQQQYMQLMREAVATGKGITEVLSTKTGEDVFTSEELLALMKLNDELRF